MEFLFVIAAGKLILETVRGFPAAKKMSVPWLDGWFIELFHCDFCLGQWVYFSLFCIFHIEVTTWAGVGYIPVLSELITAAIVSWTVHLLSLGWKFKYGEFNV